jgi:hypothetical protein
LHGHDWWFSPGNPASPTTKTGRHDIDEILLKAALNTINQITVIKLSSMSFVQSERHFYWVWKRDFNSYFFEYQTSLIFTTGTFVSFRHT